MNIMDWFEALGSLATLITGMFTLGTLIEMKNEREISKRPDLIIRNNEEIVLHDDGYSITRNWINEKFYRQKNTKMNAYLTVENIGLGVAKDIEVEWKYKVDNTLERIIKDDMNFYIDKKDDISLLSYKSDFDEIPTLVVLGISPEIQNIEYLSPNRDNIYCGMIEIPLQYQEIFSTLVFVYADKDDYSYKDLSAPQLICYLNYKNIYGKKYRIKYEIEFKLFNAISNNAEIKNDEIIGDQTNVAGVNAIVKMTKFSR